MTIRVLPSDIQARTFELLGAVPLKMDLTEAIDGVVHGTLDAQENPFANTVTYGVHAFHRYHTRSNHFYVSRPVFAHRDTFDSWPCELREAIGVAVHDAVAFQRGLAEQEDRDAQKEMETKGCEIVELTADDHAAFVSAVRQQHDEARVAFGDDMFKLLNSAL